MNLNYQSKTPDPDLNVTVRTAVITGVVGFFTAEKFHLDHVVLSAIGVVVGAVYDAIAFNVKVRMQQKKS